MKTTVTVHTQEGSAPMVATNEELDNIEDWLREINQPGRDIRDSTTAPEAESSNSHSSCSIRFVDLAPEHAARGFADGQDTTRAKGVLLAMGYQSSRIVVVNDTIDFNIHYPANKLAALEDATTLPLYSIADNEIGICWTWNIRCCRVRGAIWHFNEAGRKGALKMMHNLSRMASIYNHALLPALLMLKMETNDMHNWVDVQGKKIMDCQVRTGYHSYSDVAPWAGDAQQRTLDDLRKMDLERMSRGISGYAVNITTSCLCMERLVQLADFVLQELEHDSQDDPGRQLVTASLTRQTRSVKRQAQGLLAEAEAWKHKSSIVVQTLLSLTAQRDQSISIQIARQATRDSTSMKAIATVTMCFLPGTFVSTLFAAPFFHWDIDPSKSISPQFWIYWAVTLPLTLVVIAVWVLWTRTTLKLMTPTDKEK